MSERPGPEVTQRVNAALDGRYRIERQVGSGGMATVYLAHDLRHDRRVALKILKPELAAVMGAERFLTEIRTTANLQHPHILQLYDSGEADGFLYFVMPFVEGETLRDRIDREKQLPIDEAVGLARAIAAALQAAHERGVVHRDIKPANILLSHGEPLVADFGIALAVQEAGGGRLTETGLSLGTPYYMSPEQATADRDPDARSDIYSLASVLYEMLTGEPPFTGNTAQAVLGKILTAAPVQPTQLRKTIPPHIEAVILKSLERLPADRFASAAEFGKALGDKAFRHGSGSGGMDPAMAAGAAVEGLQRRVQVMTGATVVLAVALGWALLGRGDPGESIPTAIEFYVQGDSTHEVVSGFPGSLALSPDGRMLAYVGQNESGVNSVHVRRLDERDARRVPGTDGANSVFFSADGAWIGYGTESYMMMRVRVAGGTPTPLATLGNTMTNGFWTEGGQIYYGETGIPGLMRISANGGQPEEIVPQSDSVTGILDPWVLPGERVVLATALYRGNKILAHDLRDGSTRFLGPGVTPRYVDGHLIYGTDDGLLLAHPFDPTRLEFTGEPVQIAADVGGWLNISRDIAVSPTGAIGFVAGMSGQNELVFYTANPTAADVIADGPSLRTPRISPDGDRVLYALGSSAQADLYVVSRSQGTTRLLVSAIGTVGASWAPNGSGIVYTGGDIMQPSIWTLSLVRGGEPEILVPSGRDIYAVTLPRYSWDGRYVIVERGPVPRDIIGLPVDEGGEPLILVDGPGDDSQNAPSPAGPWLAYTSDETGRFEVYVKPMGPGAPMAVSRGGGLSPVWSRTGDTLFYRPSSAAGTNNTSVGIAFAALDLGDDARVLGRGTLSTTAPPIEAVTLPAQFDMHADGMAFVAATSGGNRIVVRTHFMPSGR